jgi:hypothetical protein
MVSVDADNSIIDMSASESIPVDEVIRPKRLWTTGTPDFRPAAVYPQKQVPGIALIFAFGTMCMWGIWKVAKSNQKRKYVLRNAYFATIYLFRALLSPYGFIRTYFSIFSYLLKTIHSNIEY